MESVQNAERYCDATNLDIMVGFGEELRYTEQVQQALLGTCYDVVSSAYLAEGYPRRGVIHMRLY